MPWSLGSLRLVRASLAIAACCVCCGYAQHAGAEPPGDTADELGVSAMPQPDWVEPVEAPARAPAPVDGLEVLLHETQVLVSGRSIVRYYHGATRPVSPAGLGEASAISIALDPTYQRYAWHLLRIRRGQQLIDALPIAELRLASGGEDDEELLRETMRVTAFVRDVRVGDVVEYAYSIEGDQPVLGGHYVDELELARSYTIGLLQHRVSFPRGRTLHIRAHGTELEPERTSNATHEIFVWRRRDTAAIQVEPHTPPSFDAQPWVQLSEFDSWSEVVHWALPLYRATKVAPEVEALANSFRGSGTPDDAAERATRFVQDEVRYLGFEFGEGSLRPRAPELVIARRFGDCKDKSLLLVSLLRVLGMEAVPVLVSTRDRAAVQGRLPSPYDFDHVIVRAELDGGPVWIDSTASYERGPLAEQRPPPFAVALPIAADSAQPEPIEDGPPSVQPDTHVHERFEIQSRNGKALLHVSTRYRAREATARRFELATRGRDEVQENYLKFYSKMYGRMRVAQPLEISDDELHNEIEVREAYTLDEGWRDGMELALWSVSPHLVRADKDKPRRAPLALAHPTHLVHEIEARLPLDIDAKNEDTRVEAPGIESSYRARYTARRLHLRKEYRTRAPQVAVDDLPEYDEAVERIESRLGYHVSEAAGGPVRGTGRSNRLPLAFPLGLVACVGAYLAIANFSRLRARARNRRSTRERAREPRAGESPDKAITVPSIAAIEARMQSLTCTCGSRSRLKATRAPAKVRYMGREVWHLSAACESCGEKETRYFMLEAGKGE